MLFEAIRKLLGGKEKSGNIANQRLSMVLLSDRASNMSPEMMEKLRDEIIQVISKYMDINKQDMEMAFEKDGSAVALVANIPVRRMRHK